MKGKLRSDFGDNDGQRKIVERMIEIIFHSEMNDVWRKMINWLIKEKSKSEFRDAQWEVFYWLVEIVSKYEVSYSGREMIN